ncbi:MAG: O-methyltransferase [Nitrososphaeraceae archaeon]
MNILLKLEDIARKNNLPSIGPIKGQIIKKIITKHKPKRILEIGALHGYSAILMTNLVLNEIKKNNKNISIENEILVTIEIDSKLVTIIQKNIKKAGLLDKIKVLNGDALKIIPKLDKNNKFDLLFLDAEKNQYIKYLKLVEENNLLNKNAIIIADNVMIYENEMTDYLDYVRFSGKYESYTTETTLEFTKNVKDALEISLRKT